MDNILTPLLTLAVVAMALAGMALVVAGLVRLLRGRILRGMSLGCFGAAVGGLAIVVGAVLINFYTYGRLTQEKTVAEVSFERLGERAYRAHFTEPGAEPRAFFLQGDEWQLDVRLIKWQGMATLLGLDPLYRLERLSGRYRNLEQERSAQRTIHGLGARAGVDVWELAQRYQRWLPWVDATYGSGVYVPLAHGARYRVQLSNSGLLARPLNAAATNAVVEWR